MRTMTVIEVADCLKTTEETVLQKIHSGELQASNINTKPNAQRPRWRILETEFASYLMRTQFQTQATERRPKRAKRTTTKDYFAS